MLDKRALRREIAAQKRALSPAQIEAASADLTAQLLAPTYHRLIPHGGRQRFLELFLFFLLMCAGKTVQQRRQRFPFQPPDLFVFLTGNG